MNGPKNPNDSERSLTVRKSPIQGRGVFAKRSLNTGKQIAYFEGYEIDYETAYSLTFGNKRIEPTGILKHLNHSCSPNTWFQGRWLIASREIKPGEEITIDYIATEPTISHHFHCDCMSKNCKGKI
jgi:SET domain-containing protein